MKYYFDIHREMHADADIEVDAVNEDEAKNIFKTKYNNGDYEDMLSKNVMDYDDEPDEITFWRNGVGQYGWEEL